LTVTARPVSDGLSARVGLGFDSHRFGPGRPLVLAGVRLPYHLGLEGHSDGDALTHAVIDALLGAAGAGNIGQWFPDDDPSYRGADSLGLLRRVREEVASRGWRPVNVDCVVVTDEPRLTPHLGDMRRRLAEALGLGEGAVEIKPKTAEGLGLAGEGRGLVALAVVLVSRTAG